MSRTHTILFAISGVLVLLASIGSPVLLPYPLLVVVVLRGWRLPRFASPAPRLAVTTALACLVLETGAWYDNFKRDAAEPALFHPQLLPDLIISVGVYSAWWLVWWRMLRTFRFSIAQVFLATGLYGVLIEQQGKIFLTGLSMMPAGLLLWLFVFTAYGSTMALAVFLVRDDLEATRAPWWRLPLTWALLLIGTIAISLTWGLLLQMFDILPPKRFPMRAHPFW